MRPSRGLTIGVCSLERDSSVTRYGHDCAPRSRPRAERGFLHVQLPRAGKRIASFRLFRRGTCRLSGKKDRQGKNATEAPHLGSRLALKMSQAKFLFELLVIPLDDPTLFG